MASGWARFSAVGRASFSPCLLAIFLLLAATGFTADELAGLKICIDPGHGGQGKSKSYTGGFVGPSGLTESKAALDIARLLREELRRAGAEVIMTRTEDKRVTREGTTAEQELLARIVFAQQRGADLLISVHTSSVKKNPEANVTRVLYHEPHASLERIFAETVGRSVSKQIDTKFTGGTPNTYPVVKEAKIPAILVEVSSISNPREERKLRRLSHTKAIAQAIGRGILLGKKSAPEALWPKRNARGAPIKQAVKKDPAKQAARPSVAAKTPRPKPRTAAKPTPRPTPKRTPRPTAQPTKIAAIAPPPLPAPIENTQIAGSSSQNIETTDDGRKTMTLPGGKIETEGFKSRKRDVFAHRDFAPILANPVEGPIDQAWLFGESYAGLPLQTGLCFVVPADTSVRAAARGRVELVVPYDQEVPKGYTREVAPYRGMVVIAHEDLKLGGKPIWTVYARMTTIYAAPGELVGEGEIIGKTGKPYDGSRASRLSSFLFEVRAGANSRIKAVNPSPLVRRPAGGDKAGALALRIRDANGRALEGVEIRGIDKQIPRYGYSLTYNSRNNPHPILNENLYIGDILPGEYTLTATVGGNKIKRALPIAVRPGKILTGTWKLPVR